MATYALKVVHKGSILGQEIRNIYWFQYYCPSGILNPNPMVHGYLTSLYTGLLGTLSSLLAFNSWEAYYATQDVGNVLVFYGEVQDPLVFTSSQDPLPNQIAAVAIGKVLGRRGFGRKFMAGVCENATLGGYIGTSFLASLAAFAAAYITQQSAGAETLTPGVGVRDKVTHTWHVYTFTSAVVTNLLGTMRRRKIGVGG